MIRLCRAANGVEADIIAGLLSTRGITTHVFNRFAASASGELPPIETSPEIWLADERDETLARRMLAERERPNGADRVCPRCGESNPAGFDLCWKCANEFE
jgi:hypothetical protein